MSEVSFPHRPVLYKETIQYLVPSSPKHYLDCTAGAGGHSEGILIESAPSGELPALDLDPLAIELTRQRLSPFGNRAHVMQASYLQSAEILQKIGWQGVDGIVMDLGVSSMQLDQSERGFSFRHPPIWLTTWKKRIWRTSSGAMAKNAIPGASRGQFLKPDP